MKTNFDRRKSLQELEQDDWGEPDFDSHLVRTCHRLRRVPLENFSDGDLRIMIGQQIGLLRLVPIALEKLEEDPLVDAELYPGDLLNAVLGIPESFWIKHTDMRAVLCRVVAKAKELLTSIDEVFERSVRDILAKAEGLLHE